MQGIRLFKEISVRAGTGEYDGTVIPQIVNEQEVPAGMAFAEAFPVAGESVIEVFGR